MKVSMFKSAISKKSIGTVLLKDWLLTSNSYSSLIKELREEENQARKKEIKDLLPAITVSCVCSERLNDCIIGYTNLICIDIDGKDNPSISNMEELKERLGKLPYIMYCGLSASGKGVFCIIPYEDYRKHKLHFYALEQEFKDMGIVVDSSCSDICRLRFYSYDEHPYVTSKPLSLREALLQPSNLDFASAVPLSKTAETERLLNLVIERQIDITSIYNDWIKIGLVIRNLFGDKGLDLFDKVSSFHPKYSQEEVEDKFFELDEEKYRASTQSLFEIAAKYGIYK